MNDYSATATVFDGGFERLTDAPMGYQWRLWFKGTVYLIPVAFPDMPTNVALMGSAVLDDVLNDISPTLAYDWLVDTKGYSIADAFSAFQPSIVENTIRVNGIRSTDEDVLSDQVRHTLTNTLDIARLAILKELPTMRHNP